MAANPKRTFFGPAAKSFRWHDSYEFARDLSNHPSFAGGFAPCRGYELNGLSSADRVFVKPREGALELHDKSGGAGASGGFDVQLPDHSTKTVRAGLNLGAVPPADRAALPAVVDYAWPPMIAPKQSETA